MKSTLANSPPSRESIDDEGPAFPVTHVNESMSLRDYFAAHAPPPPDSFVWNNLKPPVRPVAVDAVAKNERLRRAISDYLRDPCFDLESCGETDEECGQLRAFEVAQDAYHSACDRWRREQEIDRLVAWRFVYAARMLAARKGGRE